MARARIVVGTTAVGGAADGPVQDHGACSYSRRMDNVKAANGRSATSAGADVLARLCRLEGLMSHLVSRMVALAGLAMALVNTSVNAPLTYPPQNFFVLPTDLANTSSMVDWYGTLRGQLGVASGPWLIYGTAGLAYGHASLSTLYRTAGFSLTAQISDVRTGWTAGAGFKYMMLPNLSVGSR
jgi:hypothetical protein